MCTVVKLPEFQRQDYSCSPREAVIAAYAQSRGDWNTWQYKEKYDKLVEEGEFTIICGDFAAFRNGRDWTE